MLGQASIRDNGSFTLTSGFLSHYLNPASIATGPLNAAIDESGEGILLVFLAFRLFALRWQAFADKSDEMLYVSFTTKGLPPGDHNFAPVLLLSAERRIAD